MNLTAAVNADVAWVDRLTASASVRSAPQHAGAAWSASIVVA